MLRIRAAMVRWSLLPLILLGGCQKEGNWALAPVHGVIRQDGRPLAGVEVVFWTDVAAGANGPQTSAFTDAEGRYELRTQAGDRGAAAGKYRVCIVTPPRPDSFLRDLSGKDGRPKLPNEIKEKLSTAGTVRVPQKFSRFDTTPLRAEVTLGNSQTFDFDVPAAPLQRKK